MPAKPRTTQYRLGATWSALRTAEQRAEGAWRCALPGELTPAQWEETRAIERELRELRRRVFALTQALPEDREGIDAA